MHPVWVTLSCNNACLFCPQATSRDDPAAPAFFSLDALEEKVRQASRSGETLAFVGGEPTLLPALPALVRLARAEGARGVVVQTNGRRLAYAAYARELRAAGVSAVDVSLHGSTAAMHEYHTQTEGSFAQTLTGIGVARAADLVVGVTCVLTRSNYRHAADIARLAVTRGARFLHFARVSQPPGAAPLAPSLLPLRELVQPYLADGARTARSLGAHVLIDQQASHPAAHEIFAGVGRATVEG